MDELSPNTTVSHYRILSKIGAGGMGEVYLAEDTRLDRPVSLKFLSAVHATEDDKLKRFTQEAKAASALNHQNILTIYEIGDWEGLPYIATEFIKGKTLRNRLLSPDPLELREALAITSQIAAALAAAHEAHIIHRDIKPENIMIRDDGIVKVLDFGLAKLSASVVASSSLATLPQVNTEPGMLLGTIAYMSPEQARGQQLDPRSDIFSLGITMFEVFTGKRPFNGEGQLDLISSILKDDPPSLKQVAPDMPPQLVRIVDKALRKDRGQRFQHVRDLQIDVDDLRDELRLNTGQVTIAEQQTVSAPAPAQTGDMRQSLTGSISTTRRFTILHAMLFALVVAVGVGAAWYFGMGASTPLPGSYKTTEVASWTSAAGELFSNASFSPDGKMIAFASTKSGTKNIWVTQTGSTEAIQITSDSFANTDPIWSAKGGEIAYYSNRSINAVGGGNLSGIWRINALGGTPKMIGTLPDLNVVLKRWSSSGRIYYQVKSDLRMMDAATGTSQIVISLPAETKLIDISEDESSVIYSVQTEEQWRIVARNLSTNQEKDTASGDGRIDSLAWRPEKERLFYAATIDGISQVFVITPGSKNTTKLSAAGTDQTVVDASPDGRSVLTSSAKEESNLWRVIVTGGQETPVVRDLTAKLWPDVSPDNSKIVFQSIKNLSKGNHLSTGSIAISSIRSREEGAPAIISDSGSLPVWSPDSSLVAFTKEISGSRDLYTINPSGGVERRLTTEGMPRVGYLVSPYNTFSGNPYVWSPDGTRIAYLSGKEVAANVWAVDVRSNTAADLTVNTDASRSFASPVWSKDGKRVAVAFADISEGQKSSYGLMVIDAGNGGSTEVYRSGRSHRLIGWSADEASLIVAEPSKQFTSLTPETTIKRVQLNSGNESTIAVLKNAYFYNIFLSYDQRSIAFAARNDDRDDLWIIPASGGTARKITSNNDSALYYSRLAWFHDGSSIAFGKQTRFSLLSMITGID